MTAEQMPGNYNVSGYDAEDLDKELSFAIGFADTESVDSMAWLAALANEKAARLEQAS